MRMPPIMPFLALLPPFAASQPKPVHAPVRMQKRKLIVWHILTNDQL